jgi:hypothetical protein
MTRKQLSAHGRMAANARWKKAQGVPKKFDEVQALKQIKRQRGIFQ